MALGLLAFTFFAPTMIAGAQIGALHVWWSSEAGWFVPPAPGNV